MNDNIIAGKWREIKGELQKAWGDLTEDELDQTQGNSQSILGLLRQKFGYAQEEAKTRFHDILRKFNLDETKETLADNVEEQRRRQNQH